MHPRAELTQDILDYYPGLNDNDLAFYLSIATADPDFREADYGIRDLGWYANLIRLQAADDRARDRAPAKLDRDRLLREFDTALATGTPADMKAILHRAASTLADPGGSVRRILWLPQKPARLQYSTADMPLLASSHDATTLTLLLDRINASPRKFECLDAGVCTVRYTIVYFAEFPAPEHPDDTRRITDAQIAAIRDAATTVAFESALLAAARTAARREDIDSVACAANAAQIPYRTAIHAAGRELALTRTDRALLDAAIADAPPLQLGYATSYRTPYRVSFGVAHIPATKR